MKFEFPEVSKVSFETEVIAAGEQVGGGVTINRDNTDPSAAPF